MSDLPMIGQVAPPSAWKMIRAMVGIGLLCGLFIVSVFQWTLPRIQRNRAEALQKAIFQVLPDARSSKTFLLESGDAFREAGTDEQGGQRVYAGYDDQGRLAGVAVEAGAMGYADVITVLYGYSFDENAIVGIRVLESKETPGLGDKIETDEDFLRNFERLDVTLDTSGSAPANPIEAVKNGQKEHPWQVDGITGATISSVAIAKMLRESTAFWVPRLRRSVEDFGQGEGS